MILSLVVCFKGYKYETLPYNVKYVYVNIFLFFLNFLISFSICQTFYEVDPNKTYTIYSITLYFKKDIQMIKIIVL